MDWKELPLIKSLFKLEVNATEDLVPLIMAIVIAGIGFSAIVYFLSKVIVLIGLIGFLFFVAWLVYNFFVERH